MFISKKRWSEMERRVTELEKQSAPKAVTVDELKSSLESAVDNAAYHFKYALATALTSGPSSRFSIDLTPDRCADFRSADSDGVRDSYGSSSTYFQAGNHK